LFTLPQILPKKVEIMAVLKDRLQYFFNLPGFKKKPASTIWRAFGWRVRCALGIPGNVRIPAWNNAALILPPEWHGAGATLFYVVREYYEPELTFLSRFLKEGETFVDAGANCGVYTISAGNIVGPGGKVLAFEPGKEIFAMLKKSVKRNDFQNVQLFEMGLSDHNGTAELYAHPHGASSFSLGRPQQATGESFTIQLKKLDDILDAEEVEKVDCIKMDVEGAEELILQGASRLFESCKPRVIFEINPAAILALGLQKSGAWDFLKNRGYNFFTIDTDGKLEKLSAQPEEGGNFIALPQE
jgi:FkbM family methyltransferase